MVLSSSAFNGRLAVKSSSRTEHVSTAVKTEAHTTSASVADFLGSWHNRNHGSPFDTTLRLTQMSPRQQRREIVRVPEFQSASNGRLFPNGVFRHARQVKRTSTEFLSGTVGEGRGGEEEEEDSQEKHKKMRVQESDEMPELLSPGRDVGLPVLALAEALEPGQLWGSSYPSSGAMSRMAADYLPLSRLSATVDPLSEPSPLGLTLKKTPSLLDLIKTQLDAEKKSAPKVDSIAQEAANLRPTTCLVPSAAAQDKMKASNFPASSLKVGTWERTSRYEGDLVGKCYYAKRKLVWEVLESGLKSKIEIQWSDIAAMKASCPDNLPGTLEIEVSRPPLFFRETNPQPRKHTLWQTSPDFTGGQATICKRHSLQFPEGVLNRHMEKLVQCDTRLKALVEGPLFAKPNFFEEPISWMLHNREFQHLPASHQPRDGHLTGAVDESGCLLPVPTPHLHPLLGSGLATHSERMFQLLAGEARPLKAHVADLSSPSSVMDSRCNEDSGTSGTSGDLEDMMPLESFTDFLQYSTPTSNLYYEDLHDVKPSYDNLYMLGGTTSAEDRRLQEISQGLTEVIRGSMEQNVSVNCTPAMGAWESGHPFSSAPMVKTEPDELPWSFPGDDDETLFGKSSLPSTSAMKTRNGSESNLLVTMPRVPSLAFIAPLHHTPQQVIFDMRHSRPPYANQERPR